MWPRWVSFTFIFLFGCVWGLPGWLRWQHMRSRFDPWVGKISWRRKWQPTPVFLTGEFHGWRSLVGYSPWDCTSRTWLSDFYFHLVSLSLSWSMWDLIPDQGVNPGPLHWEHRVIAAGPPAKSPRWATVTKKNARRSSLWKCEAEHHRAMSYQQVNSQ